MTDYIFEVPLSNEGRDIVTDPDILDSIISEGTYMIREVTYNNLTVDTVDFDAETKRVYYGVSASPTMKIGLASLNDTERLAWKHVLMAGLGIAGAVLCVSVSPWVAAGVLVVAGVAIAIDYFTGMQEVQMEKEDTKQIILEKQSEECNPLYHNPDLAKDYFDSVDESWGSEFKEMFKWIALIGGGAIVAMIVLRTIPRKKD